MLVIIRSPKGVMVVIVATVAMLVVMVVSTTRHLHTNTSHVKFAKITGTPQASAACSMAMMMIMMTHIPKI
jgi:hypothetical protein